MPKRRYIQAVNDALFEEMERDPKVILFGEDVEIAMMGDTRGLLAKFGRNRIRNTPICEATLTGMSVGAAAAGYRVILHMMFSNFIYTGFDAIANQMAKLRLMTHGLYRALSSQTLNESPYVGGHRSRFVGLVGPLD